jgi:hypothetical protein
MILAESDAAQLEESNIVIFPANAAMMRTAQQTDAAARQQIPTDQRRWSSIDATNTQTTHTTHLRCESPADLVPLTPSAPATSAQILRSTTLAKLTELHDNSATEFALTRTSIFAATVSNASAIMKSAATARAATGFRKRAPKDTDRLNRNSTRTHSGSTTTAAPALSCSLSLSREWFTLSQLACSLRLLLDSASFWCSLTRRPTGRIRSLSLP